MSASPRALRAALGRRPLLLDGATGTELQRRGLACPLPLWSAGALLTHPELVGAIHRDYVAAGADIITANTFRTNPRALRRAGRLSEGPRLNRLAIALARAAAREVAARGQPAAGRARTRRGPGRAASDPLGKGRVWVAASVAPVEDCYAPQRVPEARTLAAEHRQMIRWLSSAGPDLIWIETMNTLREARLAARAAADAGLPFVVSFVLRQSGKLLGGDPLSAAVAAVEPFAPLAVGVNCVPPRAVAGFVRRLRDMTDRPLLAYAHINNRRPIRGWSYAQRVRPGEYCRYARGWLELGVSIIGGCCGTTPAHTAALRELLMRGRGGATRG